MFPFSTAKKRGPLKNYLIINCIELFDFEFHSKIQILILFEYLITNFIQILILDFIELINLKYHSNINLNCIEIIKLKCHPY